MQELLSTERPTEREIFVPQREKLRGGEEHSQSMSVLSVTEVPQDGHEKRRSGVCIKCRSSLSTHCILSCTGNLYSNALSQTHVTCLC